MPPQPKDRSVVNNNNNKLFSIKDVSLNALESEHAIHSLQKLLQFPTVSATAADTGAYSDCAAFLLEELQSLGFLEDIQYLPESPKNAPIVVACWRGHDTTLPVILLNSHYDVVPANVDEWTVPPFEGLRTNHKIYGRGAQDMKCVCMQYICALRKLHSHCRSSSNNHTQQDFRPTRSIYLTFVPDEEMGGAGMAAFLSSNLYNSSLPGIALALDEGLASTDSTFSVFYGERLPWWVDVTARGNVGHGSRFIEQTAVEQLIDLCNKALAFRQGQRDLLFGDPEKSHAQNCSHAAAAKKSSGDVTSLNITTLEAGVRVADTHAYNCVPPTARCSLDIRISPHVEPSTISDMLDGWCRECSSSSKNTNDDHNNNNKVTWKYLEDGLQKHATTSTDVKVNPWYGVFCDAMSEMGHSIRPQVFPAATDSRFLRALGIRALGFSPMRHTEILLHENDEYIPEETYLEGIVVYVGLLHALATAPKDLGMTQDEGENSTVEAEGATGVQ